MKWTSMQEKAVTAPVSNILVAAAAGSGKTQVLTGRILDRIQNHNSDISRMLVITFTNAAAAEMRERIKGKISEAVSTSPSLRMKRQLALVDSSDISTIHSFCLKLLRSYFYKIDLDPSFSIASDYDTKIMKSEALSEAMDYFYEAEDDDFLSFIDLVCSSKNDYAAANMISSVINTAQSDPFPEKWLDKALSLYKDISESNAPFSIPLIKKALALLKDAKEGLKKAIETADATTGLEGYSQKFNEELSYLSSLDSTNPSWDDLYSFFSINPFTRCPAAKKDCDAFLKEQSKFLRDNAKSCFEKASSLIDMPLIDAVNETSSMRVCVSALVSAAKKAIEIYNDKKREKNVLDYSDLEHLTIKLLSEEDENGNLIPSFTANEVRDCYDEIYIDEYQDTNDIQETIIKMISSESKGLPNVFMVGDMKQSIYRFRMTNPKRIFGKKSLEYTHISDSNPEDLYIKIPLSDNFRSHPKVLDSVNSVFDKIMSENAGEVDYVGDERLSYEKDFYQGELSLPPMELKILTLDNSCEKEDLILAQCDYLSQRIKKIVSNKTKVFDKKTGKMREIKYSDIAVLFRRPKIDAPTFERSLKNYGIPTIYDADSNFFDAEEIRVILSLLRIIDNPLQDIPLIHVMRSPLFNFDENALAEYALLNKPYLYDALVEFSCEKDENNKKCKFFLEKLKKWRKEASLMTVYDFLEKLITETSYLSFVSSMPDSEIRLENISLLQRFAEKSDSSNYKGLFNFLKYVDNLYSSGSLSSEGTFSPDINAVRIMSIHKSKGLEFPFVFLCRAENKRSLKDYTGDLLLSNTLGIGINAFYEKRYKKSLPMNKAIAYISKDEATSEELRVLYVALTRAREHIEIISSVKVKKNEEKYILPEIKEFISSSDVLEATSYLDWLLLSRGKKSGMTVSVLESQKETPEESATFTLNKPFSIKCPEKYDEILSYSYEKKNLFTIKNKYSVSELKSGKMYEEVSDSSPLFSSFSEKKLSRPSFLNCDKVFTSAQKGSIMHYVMERLPLEPFLMSDFLSALNMSNEEISSLDTQKIKNFTESEFFYRMINSSFIQREAPFTFYKKISELSSKEEDKNNDALVLIQGIIDLFFIENDEIVLLDYKTDKNTNHEEIRKRYSLQLSLYEEALKKRYNLPVKEKYIYLFESNEFVRI